MPADSSEPIAVLVSGGLDSCILAAHLARKGRAVQPIHIRTDVVWAAEELVSLRAYLESLRRPSVRPLLVLDLPLADVYGQHWSTTGRDTPDAQSADEAVFLPGRNALLLIKAVVWCQLHGITRLAMAPLGTSPFEDAREAFVRNLEAALNAGDVPKVQIERPFGTMTKQEVMALGRELPLERTFSCIHPVDGVHCGQCNKCDERKKAFVQAGLIDRTRYAGKFRGD